MSDFEVIEFITLPEPAVSVDGGLAMSTYIMVPAGRWKVRLWIAPTMHPTQRQAVQIESVYPEEGTLRLPEEPVDLIMRGGQYCVVFVSPPSMPPGTQVNIQFEITSWSLLEHMAEVAAGLA